MAEPIKNKGGRPRKLRQKPGPKPKLFDEAIRNKLLEAYAYDATDEEACLYADISTDTLARYKKKNLQFAERINTLRNTPLLGARQTMVKAIREDPKWAGWYMERKAKDEFSLRTEVSGPNGEMPVVALVEFVKGKNATKASKSTDTGSLPGTTKS